MGKESSNYVYLPGTLCARRVGTVKIIAQNPWKTKGFRALDASPQRVGTGKTLTKMYDYDGSNLVFEVNIQCVCDNTDTDYLNAHANHENIIQDRDNCPTP